MTIRTEIDFKTKNVPLCFRLGDLKADIFVSHSFLLLKIFDEHCLRKVFVEVSVKYSSFALTLFAFTSSLK